MVGWDAAVMAMIGISAMGFLVANGERQRYLMITAMRRCLLRINHIIRYEKPPLRDLLLRIDLRTTPQERELTRLLHACAERMDHCTNPQLMLLFTGESAHNSAYNVLSETDRSAFETLLGDLGRMGLEEQLRLIDNADERLRVREEDLRAESGRRAQMIRTLGLAGGAAMFLLLV